MGRRDLAQEGAPLVGRDAEVRVLVCGRQVPGNDSKAAPIFFPSFSFPSLLHFCMALQLERTDRKPRGERKAWPVGRGFEIF